MDPCHEDKQGFKILTDGIDEFNQKDFHAVYKDCHIYYSHGSYFIAAPNGGLFARRANSIGQAKTKITKYLNKLKAR